MRHIEKIKKWTENPSHSLWKTTIIGTEENQQMYFLAGQSIVKLLQHCAHETATTAPHKQSISLKSLHKNRKNPKNLFRD